MTATHQLKRTLKHGPRLSREMRTEFLRFLVGAPPRPLSEPKAAKLRTELSRLENAPNSVARYFAAAMRRERRELWA